MQTTEQRNGVNLLSPGKNYATIVIRDRVQVNTLYVCMVAGDICLRYSSTYLTDRYHLSSVMFCFQVIFNPTLIPILNNLFRLYSRTVIFLYSYDKSIRVIS